MSVKIIGIMAATSEGVVGKGNNLPWCYKDELEHFKSVTKNHAVVIGRKSFAIAPSNIFIDRMPIVFSRNHPLKTDINYISMSCIEDFIVLIKSFYRQKIFMIGGAEIAHLFLKANIITEFLLTKIHKPYQGDIYLNLEFFNGWTENILYSNLNYSIIKLKNPKIAKD